MAERSRRSQKTSDDEPKPGPSREDDQPKMKSATVKVKRIGQDCSGSTNPSTKAEDEALELDFNESLDDEMTEVTAKAVKAEKRAAPKGPQTPAKKPKKIGPAKKTKTSDSSTPGSSGKKAKATKTDSVEDEEDEPPYSWENVQAEWKERMGVSKVIRFERDIDTLRRVFLEDFADPSVVIIGSVDNWGEKKDAESRTYRARKKARRADIYRMYRRYQLLAKGLTIGETMAMSYSPFFLEIFYAKAPEENIEWNYSLSPTEQIIAAAKSEIVGKYIDGTIDDEGLEYEKGVVQSLETGIGMLPVPKLIKCYKSGILTNTFVMSDTQVRLDWTDIKELGAVKQGLTIMTSDYVDKVMELLKATAAALTHQDAGVQVVSIANTEVQTDNIEIMEVDADMVDEVMDRGCPNPDQRGTSTESSEPASPGSNPIQVLAWEDNRPMDYEMLRSRARNATGMEADDRQLDKAPDGADYCDCIMEGKVIGKDYAPAKKCKNRTCPLSYGYRPEDFLVQSKGAYPSLTLKKAMELSKMGKDTAFDLETRKRRVTYIYGLTRRSNDYTNNHFAPIDHALEKKGFYEAIEKHNFMTVDVEGFSPSFQAAYGCKYSLTKGEFDNMACYVHFGSPNGNALGIRVQFMGRKFDGKEIPEKIKKLLASTTIKKIGFGIVDDLKTFKSMGAPITNWVEAAHFVLMLDRQLDSDAVRTGKRHAMKILGVRHSVPDMKYWNNLYDKPVDEYATDTLYYDRMDQFGPMALLYAVAGHLARQAGCNEEDDVMVYVQFLLALVMNRPAKIGPNFAMDFVGLLEERGGPQEVESQVGPLKNESHYYNTFAQVNKHIGECGKNFRFSKAHLANMDRKEVSTIEDTIDHRITEWHRPEVIQSARVRVLAISKLPKDLVLFPHPCYQCGSYGHEGSTCKKSGTCKVPTCKMLGHHEATCPMMLCVCNRCDGRGHLADSHKKFDLAQLYQMWRAGCMLHPAGIRTMNAESEFVATRSGSGFRFLHNNSAI